MYREEIYKMLKTLQGEHILKKKSQEHKLSCARICFFMQETWSLQGFVLVRKEHLEMRMVLIPCAQTSGTLFPIFPILMQCVYMACLGEIGSP